MNRPGFTLLELLVAMTVGGIAISIGVSTIRILVDADGASGSVAGPGVAVVNTIRNWIETAEVGPNSTLVGVTNSANGWTADELVLSTSSAYPLDPAPARIHLRIAGDSGLIASIEQSTGLRNVVLIPDVKGLAVEFGSFTGEGILFQQTWRAPELAPDVIRIRLEYPPEAYLELSQRLPITAHLRGR